MSVESKLFKTVQCEFVPNCFLLPYVGLLNNTWKESYKYKMGCTCCAQSVTDKNAFSILNTYKRHMNYPYLFWDY